jgi:hypothetical protein
MILQLALSILLLFMTVTIIVLAIYLAKSRDCLIAKESLPSEFIFDNEPNILDLQKIQSCKFGSDGIYSIIDTPLYLKHGISLYSDPKLNKLTEEEIIDQMNKLDGYQFKFSITDIISMSKEAIQKNKNDPLFSKEIKMHLQDIVEYLKHNSSDIEMQNLLNELTKIGQYVDDLINDIHEVKTKTTNIYSKFINWVKFIISKGGGLDAILDSIRPVIKQQFYLDLISLSTVNTNDNSSGECSLPPYQLWQKCPDNTIPTGSQGYKNQYCNKWYQKFSGTLLCSSTGNTKSFDTLDSCKKIANAINQFKKIDYIFDDSNSYKTEMIKLIVHAIQNSVAGVPQANAVAQILSSIFHRFLKDYRQVENIYADLQDVCLAFSCPNDSCEFDPKYVKTILSRQCSLQNPETCPKILPTLQLSNNKSNNGIGNFGYF